MDCKRNCLSIWIMFCALLWRHVQASQNHSQDSLNSFLYDYALKRILPRPRTGKLYDVSPPPKLSGMEVSVLRLRTHSLWKNGANFSSVEIPPMILPSPFTRRVDIVYQNLGNWSTSYYNVTNYTFVAPVIGFQAYDSNTSSMDRRLVELDIRGDNPIIVRFDNISQDVGMKCVAFGTNGSLEFSNVTATSWCVARNQGLFSIVVPYQPRESKGKKVFKWWMVGIPAGIVGLILVAVVGILGFRLFKWRRVRKMERESEKSEGLDAIWVGNSRMPSASGIRTRPILENSYVP